MVLPGEATLADKMTVVDVDAIHAARDATRAAIGRALFDRLRATYDALTDTGRLSHRWRLDRAAVAAQHLPCLPDGERRSFRRQPGQGAVRRWPEHDRCAGRAECAVGGGRAERTDALAAFYAAWRDDPLVLDKWFAHPGASPLPNTVSGGGGTEVPPPISTCAIPTGCAR